MGNFTDREAFMLKNNAGIFVLCETNLHDDIQTTWHGLGVYVKSNLPIARETILEDENESYMCFRLALLHSITFIFF